MWSWAPGGAALDMSQKVKRSVRKGTADSGGNPHTCGITHRGANTNTRRSCGSSPGIPASSAASRNGDFSVLRFTAIDNGDARALSRRFPCSPRTRRSWSSPRPFTAPEVATGKEARDIYQLDEYWGSADEALAKLGYPPNRKPGQRGFLHHA